MSTTSKRSSGTQINKRGVSQGSTLVGPSSGLPFDEIIDSAGKRRLAVDVNYTAQNIAASVELDYQEDSVCIGDPSTNNLLSIEPDGSINANIKIDSQEGDSVLIKDENNHSLKVNSDGSLNINIVESHPGTLKSFYNEITNVATSVKTLLQSYIVPVDKFSYLQKIEMSGSNIAEYSLKVNGEIQDKKRSYFSSSLNLEFKFVDTEIGFLLEPGDVVSVEVLHNRPYVGDFNSRIQIFEV